MPKQPLIHCAWNSKLIHFYFKKVSTIYSSVQHIIWLTPGFAASESDDNCIPPLQILAKSLKDVPDIKLHIISLHYPQSIESYTYYGHQVYPCGYNSWAAKLRTRSAAYQQAKKLLKRYPKAILHSFWLSDAAFIGYILQWKYKLRHLVTLMGQDARPSNRYLPLFPVQEMELICLSDFHRTTLTQSRPGVQADIIPWGIPEQEISPKADQDRTYDIVGIGSLIKLKNFGLFLDVLGKVQKNAPPLKCLLIGDGPERTVLEAQAQALGLEKQVQFTGKLARAEVLEYLSQAKAVLHTSTYESFGYILLEGLARGAKVISTPVGVAPEIDAIKTATNADELAHLVRQAFDNVQTSDDLPKIYRLNSVKEEYLKRYRKGQQGVNESMISK